MIIYLLQGSGYFFGITWLVAIIINYVKLDEARADPVAITHFQYQIRTFWYGMLWLIISGMLSVFVVGLLSFLVTMIWILYRIIKGVIRLAENEAM